jgi:hypothetical protein
MTPATCRYQAFSDCLVQRMAFGAPQRELVGDPPRRRQQLVLRVHAGGVPFPVENRRRTRVPGGDVRGSAAGDDRVNSPRSCIWAEWSDADDRSLPAAQ